MPGQSPGRTPFWRDAFWWQWVAANGIAELVGLGSVALAGYLAFRHFAEPTETAGIVAMAVAFVILGAFEGAVVGIAQARVLRSRLPALRGWVRATVAGAMVAWAVGMVPSTVMRLTATAPSVPPEEPGLLVVLALAAGLGLAAGPILAAFQWLCLRAIIRQRALVWLPANAAAWAVGMPVVFLGARVHDFVSSVTLVVVAVVASLLAAGAVVGAVHGRVLLWLMRYGVAVEERRCPGPR